MEDEFQVYHLSWQIENMRELQKYYVDMNVDWEIGSDRVSGVFKILDDKFMVQALGKQRYSEEKILIPKNFESRPLSEKERDFFLSPPKPRPKLGLEMSEWIENARPRTLTIQDILFGRDRMELLVLNCDNVEPTDTPCDPEFFFRFQKATFKNSRDLKGALRFRNGDRLKIKNFEFHVEYKEEWHPLKDGYVFDIHYTSLPETTRVGWKGPVMEWIRLSQEPKVWLKEI